MYMCSLQCHLCMCALYSVIYVCFSIEEHLLILCHLYMSPRGSAELALSVSSSLPRPLPLTLSLSLSLSRAPTLCCTDHSISRSSAPSRASCSCFSRAVLSRASCVRGMCEIVRGAREMPREGAIVRERERERASSVSRSCVCVFVCVRAHTHTPTLPPSHPPLSPPLAPLLTHTLILRVRRVGDEGGTPWWDCVGLVVMRRA